MYRGPKLCAKQRGETRPMRLTWAICTKQVTVFRKITIWQQNGTELPRSKETFALSICLAFFMTVGREYLWTTSKLISGSILPRPALVSEIVITSYEFAMQSLPSLRDFKSMMPNDEHVNGPGYASRSREGDC